MKKVIRKVYAGANGSLLCTLPKEVVIALNLQSSDNIVFEVINDKEFLVKKIEL